jgi:hypothetical protein
MLGARSIGLHEACSLFPPEDNRVLAQELPTVRVVISWPISALVGPAIGRRPSAFQGTAAFSSTIAGYSQEALPRSSPWIEDVVKRSPK